eukprot:5685679-Ditylum_brightwellii.AAC.1
MKEKKVASNPSTSKGASTNYCDANKDDNDKKSAVSKDVKFSSNTDGTSPLNKDPVHAKIFKIINISMPIDPSIMHTDHNKPAGSAGVSLKNNPAYLKYFKMLKVGMPICVVQNAMQ